MIQPYDEESFLNASKKGYFEMDATCIVSNSKIAMRDLLAIALKPLLKQLETISLIHYYSDKNMVLCIHIMIFCQKGNQCNDIGNIFLQDWPQVFDWIQIRWLWWLVWNRNSVVFEPCLRSVWHGALSSSNKDVGRTFWVNNLLALGSKTDNSIFVYVNRRIHSTLAYKQFTTAWCAHTAPYCHTAASMFHLRDDAFRIIFFAESASNVDCAWGPNHLRNNNKV